jgi:hypothetical protein
MHFRSALVVLPCALLAACQSTPPATTPETISAAPAPVLPATGGAAGWVRTELYFGIAPVEAEGLGLSAAEGSWRAFLDEEVTPRFPDGLTVLDAYGQWRADAASEVGRVRSRVLVIVHPDTPAKRAEIEAIRAAYRERTGAMSVLAVETPVRSPRF